MSRRDTGSAIRKLVLTLVGISAGLLLLSGCASSAAPPAPTSAPKPAAPTAAPTTAAAPAAASPAKAPESAIGPAEKPKLVFSTWNANYANEAPFYIAMDKGFFKDEGIEVQIVETEQGLEGAVGGSIDIAHSDTGPFVAATQKGVKAKAISPWRTGEFFIFAVKDSIKTPADLVGKNLLNYPVGDRFFNLHLGFMKDAGWDTTQYKPNWIQMPGGSDPRAQAFVDGKVDGTYIMPRHKEMVTKAGGKILYEKLVNWPQESLVVTDAFASKNPNTIAHFLRAIIKAQQLYTDKSNKDYVIKLMEGKGFKISDVFKNAYEYEPLQFSADMGFEPADLKRLLDGLMTNAPEMSTFYNLQFLSSAQKSLGLKARPAQ